MWMVLFLLSFRGLLKPELFLCIESGDFVPICIVLDWMKLAMICFITFNVWVAQVMTVVIIGAA